MTDLTQEPMLELFIFETLQLIEQLEQDLISSEKSSGYSEEEIHQIFRTMHTIKGSSAMMNFEVISMLSHSIEDLFFYLREEKPEMVDCTQLTDIVLESIDFIKGEISKIVNKIMPNGDPSLLIQGLEGFLCNLKNQKPTLREKKPSETGYGNDVYLQPMVSLDEEKNVFEAIIYFEEDCGMEHIRAFSVINELKDKVDECYHIPQDLESENSISLIRQDGFKINFKTSCNFDQMSRFFANTIFLKEFKLLPINSQFQKLLPPAPAKEHPEPEKDLFSAAMHQTMISVHVDKLDKLMDLVGELVISEAMVTQNPDLHGLGLTNFQKAARQLQKITGELQDTVMSIRMVPLSVTLQKMYRVVRDMAKKLHKEVRLEIIGEETEVDKNIIEHISDPLMHLVRNAIDHGIESAEERKVLHKPVVGTVTLEAKNAGGDVLISIKDDGKGLNRDKILARAREQGLLQRPEHELTDKEIYAFIFLPGFSTKEQVSEFSGRGVGMDVVAKNIEAIGGQVTVTSGEGQGTTITIKIPLTLAIMDGMTIRVGQALYTIPIISIRESFKAREQDVITDPDGQEMIMVRGECHPILRLHELYRVKTGVTQIPEGIMVMVESDTRRLCLFADELVGEQQVVVKMLPAYIRNIRKVRGLAGCTLLGDGSISLILDTAGLVKH